MPKRKDMEAEYQPWEQQDGESAKAFEAFATYRDLGAERSIAKTGQKLHKNLTTLGEWSVKWKWVERCRAYDREMDRQARVRAVQDVRSMTDRHIRIAMQLQRKALEALEQLDVTTLSPKMQLAFLAKATEIERLNRLTVAGMDDNGQPESNDGVEIVIEGEDDADD